MPAIFLWCPSAFGRNDEAAGEGRIGLAVQYADPFEHVTWEWAASLAPDAVVRSLLLCLLDRHEWGQFGVTKSGLVFYDLERLFPRFCAERTNGQAWDDVGAELRQVTDEYRRMAPSFVQEVLDKAVTLGLTKLFRTAVAHAATITSVDFTAVFDLYPHPLAEQIVAITADVTMVQFRHVARLLRV